MQNCNAASSHFRLPCKSSIDSMEEATMLTHMKESVSVSAFD